MDLVKDLPFLSNVHITPERSEEISILNYGGGGGEWTRSVEGEGLAKRYDSICINLRV